MEVVKPDGRQYTLKNVEGLVVEIAAGIAARYYVC